LHTWDFNGVITPMLQSDHRKNGRDGRGVDPASVWSPSQVAFDPDLPPATTRYQRYPSITTKPGKRVQFI